MSPFTSLSRTLAHDASFVGVILMPYFLSNSIAEAITTDAQSVSGMKPTFTSFFSGPSEPPAQAACRTPAGTSAINDAYPAVTPAVRRNSRRAGRDVDLSFLHDINDSTED